MKQTLFYMRMKFFIIAVFLIPLSDAMEAVYPPAPPISAPSAQEVTFEEGWVWRKEFKITVNGQWNEAISQKINDLHEQMARKEEWVYDQVKDKEGKTPAVNIAFATIGFLVKSQDGGLFYETLPLIDPDTERELAFLSGQAFSENVKSSLRKIDSRYMIIEPNPSDLLDFISARMKLNMPTDFQFISSECLDIARAELENKTKESALEDRIFGNLQEIVGNFYRSEKVEDKNNFIEKVVIPFESEIQRRVNAGTIKINEKAFSVLFHILKDDSPLESNPLQEEDIQNLEELIKFFNQLESIFNKRSENKEEQSLKSSNLGQNFLKILRDRKGFLVRLQKELTGPKETSDEFTGHTEQHILHFLSKNNDFQTILKNRVKSILDKGIEILAINLHLHSRLDVCERCAPSIARELEFVRNNVEYDPKKNMGNIFAILIKNLKEKAFFNIFVSSLHTSKNRETGQEGYRRRVGYDQNHNSAIELLTNNNKLFMKALGTIDSLLNDKR